MQANEVDWSQVYKVVGKIIRKYANHEDEAEEWVQDVIEDILKHLPEYDPSLVKFYTWVGLRAKWYPGNQIRKKVWRRSVAPTWLSSDTFTDMPGASADWSVDRVIDMQVDPDATQALSSLDPQLRDLLAGYMNHDSKYMKTFKLWTEGYSKEEIAEIIKVSPISINNYLYKAREMMKYELEAHFDLG